ncbi:hypothetical protein XPA_001012 [Xanthoria parietina]
MVLAYGMADGSWSDSGSHCLNVIADTWYLRRSKQYPEYRCGQYPSHPICDHAERDGQDRLGDSALLRKMQPAASSQPVICTEFGLLRPHWSLSLFVVGGRWS